MRDLTHSRIGILCFFIIIFLSRKAISKNQVVVNVRTSHEQIVQNDLLFVKVILLNKGDLKFIKQIPSIFTSVKLYLKRPGKDRFQKLEYNGEGMSDRVGANLPLLPEHTYLTYKILQFDKEGIVTNSSGVYELKAAVDYQGNGDWIKSDPVQFRVQKTRGLSVKLLKNFEFYLKDFGYMPNIEKAPEDLEKEKIIQKLINDLKPSNLKHWLKWKYNLLMMQKGKWPEDVDQFKKKLQEIKQTLGPIAYQMAIKEVSWEYRSLDRWNRALKMIRRLQSLLPRTVTFDIREIELIRRIQHEETEKEN